jgi:hypothetical protein
VLDDILKYVHGPDNIMAALDGVETGGPFHFGCDATLHFTVGHRYEALQLMEVEGLVPEPLSFVQFQDGRTSMWPGWCKEGQRNPIVKKDSLVPFTYMVEQKLRATAIRTITWFARPGGETRVVCEAKIIIDQALFLLEHQDDIANNAVLWRWVRNEHFPKSSGRGPALIRGFGHRWDSIKGGSRGARTEFYWPYRFIPLEKFKTRYEVGLFCLYGEKAEGMVGPDE